MHVAAAEPTGGLQFRSPSQPADPAPVVATVNWRQDAEAEAVETAVFVETEPMPARELVTPVSFVERLTTLAESDHSDNEKTAVLLADTDTDDSTSRLAQLLEEPSEAANPFERIENGDLPAPANDAGAVTDAIEDEIQRRARGAYQEPESLDEETEPREESADEFLDRVLTDGSEEADDFDPFAPTADDDDGLFDMQEDDLQFGDDRDRSRGEMLEQERLEAERNCEEEYEGLRSDRIDSISLDIRVEGDPGVDYPFECGLGTERYTPREWPQITYTWKASNLCHKPLYFEQVALERHGRSFGFYAQPLLSGAHFFGSLPILPYKMGLKTPNECVYTLGHYRPGNCAPNLAGGLPFTWRAAGFMGGVYTGATFIFP